MFNESDYLTHDELTLERTGSEYCAWIQQKIHEWRADSDAAIENEDDDELSRRILLRIGIFSTFYHEAFPLYHYIIRTGRDNETSRCSVHHDSHLHFDAFVATNTHLEKIEITQALEPRHDVRMEQLIENGTVNSLGKMSVQGTRRTGRTVAIDPDMVSDSSILDNIKNYVSSSLHRKTTNRTVNQDYDPSATLLVSFDDNVLDDTDSPELDSRFLDIGVREQTTFKKVSIIGESGKLYFEYERIKKD